MTKPVTDDDLYRHSSQFRLWSFTKDEFAKKLQQTYDTAREKMIKSLEEKGANLEPLTFQEERDLVRYYASKIGDIASIFQMPSQIKATATSYFLKFYLVNSVMEYHPKNIMYTCVFFASKSENYFVSINDFCSRIPRTSPQEILNLEFVILQSLSFTLAVHNPLKALHGFFLDIQSVLPDRAAKLGSLHDKARQLIIQGFISNCIFFYAPPQIALAALMSEDEGKDIVSSYLSQKYSSSDQQRSHIMGILEECLEDLKDCEVPSAEEGKRIDKKLHTCINPSKYLAKRKQDSLGNNGGGNSAEPEAKRIKMEESPTPLPSAPESSKSGSEPPMDPAQQKVSLD